MGDDRPNAYVESAMGSDTLILRGSAFGYCEKALIAAGTGLPGAPPPDWLLGKFAEGIAAEPVILSALDPAAKVLDRADKPATYAVRALNPLVATDYRNLAPSVLPTPRDGQFTIELPVVAESPSTMHTVIRGHLDGLCEVYMSASSAESPDPKVGETWLVEAKAFGPDLWRKWINYGLSAFPNYEAQCNIYLHATGATGVLFVVGEKDDDGVVTVDRVRVEAVRGPLGPLGLVKAKARRISMAVLSGVVPDSCAEADFPCPFFHLHTGDGDKVRVDLRSLGARSALSPAHAGALDELEALAAIHADAAEMVRQGEAIRKEHRDRIVELVGILAGCEGGAVRLPGFDVQHVVKRTEERTVTYKASVSSYPLVKPIKKEE